MNLLVKINFDITVISFKKSCLTFFEMSSNKYSIHIVLSISFLLEDKNIIVIAYIISNYGVVREFLEKSRCQEMMLKIIMHTLKKSKK